MLAVGTLEPRKNLARIAEACRGLELRVVGARGWGGVEPPAGAIFLGEVGRRGARAALPRRALPRLRRRSTRASASRSPRRSPAAARSSRAPAARWPSCGDVVAVDPLDPRRSAPGSSARERRGAAAVAALARGRRGDARASTRRSRDEDRRSSTRTCSAAAAPATRRTSSTCCASSARLRRRPADRRRHAPSRSSCPTGVEPLALPRAASTCGWRCSCRSCCAGSGPTSRTSSTRCRSAARGRAVVTVHDLSFERDPSLMPLADRSSSGRVVPRSRAAPRARLRGLGADEARPGRALRHPAEKIVVTPNGVDPAFTPGDRRYERAVPAVRRRDPGAQGPARGARRGARRSGCRSSSSARRRSRRSRRELRAGGADLRGYVEKERARRPLPRRGGARAAVALRGLRPAGARGDGLRHAGRRGARAGAARGRGRRGGLRRAGDARATARPARDRRARARSRAGGARAREALLVGGDRAADARRLPRAARREGLPPSSSRTATPPSSSGRCPRSRRRSTSCS